MARIFSNCKEAINEIERDIMEMGIQCKSNSMQNKIVKGNDDFSTLEVQNYSFSILDGSDRMTISPSPEWILAEFEERISKGINPGEAYKLREAVWTPFLVDGKFDYTYSERYNADGQLDLVIAELKKNPDTRQAIVQVFDSSDGQYLGGKRRVPCSIYYQLMIRRGKLDIIYNMRSSDYDTHFKNDVILAMKLQEYVGSKINAKIGTFHMNVGSLHRYKNYTTKHVF